MSAYDLTKGVIAEPTAGFISKHYQRFAAALQAVPVETAKKDAPVAALRIPPPNFVRPAALLALGATPGPIPEAAPNFNLRSARLQSPSERLHLTASSLTKAQHCLASAIYFEARNEPVRGQIAVAQVVVNRVFSGYYPNDLCDVVYQNASQHLDCQFTFACDGKRKVINERGAWARANQIAGQVLAGDLYDPAVGSSTHYHALYVRPNWVEEMKKLARHGTHNFYRPVAWGNGTDAPTWGVVPLPPDKGKAY